MADKLIELKDGIIVKISDINNDIPEAISSKKKVIESVEGSFDKVKEIVIKSCDTITEAWLDINKKMQADTASVEFGLSFSGKGSVYFVEANAEANIKIKINWDFKQLKKNEV